MALATKSGALWQMSRAEKDEGWTDEGHAFVGREVVRSTSATAQSVGTIYCWLPPTVEDCYEDEDGKPAPLFKVRFLVGELDGDVEDLDIRQVVESLVTESVLRPPPRRIHRRQTLARCAACVFVVVVRFFLVAMACGPGVHTTLTPST